MVMRPVMRYVALYVAVEFLAVVLMVWAIGVGRTLLVLAAGFVVGVVLAGSQLKGQVGAIRQRRRTPQGAVADGVLVGLGSFLVFLPGLVSTVAGALMLAPPTRAAMRPLAAGLLDRGIMRTVGSVNFTRFERPAGYGDYIDGYIDGEVVDEPVRHRGAPPAAIARRTTDS